MPRILFKKRKGKFLSIHLESSLSEIITGHQKTCSGRESFPSITAAYLLLLHFSRFYLCQKEEKKSTPSVQFLSFLFSVLTFSTFALRILRVSSRSSILPMYRIIQIVLFTLSSRFYVPIFPQCSISDSKKDTTL